MYGGFGFGTPYRMFDPSDPNNIFDSEEERRRRRMLQGLSMPSSAGVREDGPKSTFTTEHPAQGFLMPQRWRGEVVGQDDARRARAFGLAALGAGLLKHAGTEGGIGAGLSEGMSGFMQAMTGSIDADRQGRRETEEIERRRAEDTRRREREDFDEEVKRTEFDEWKYQRDRGRELRANTGKSAASMVADIERIAGGDSPEARRARALLELGDDVNLGGLASIHDSVTQRSRRDEDAALETRHAGERQEHLAGLPSAQREQARADAYLGVAQSNAARYGSEGHGQPSIAQYANDVEQEIDRLVAPKMDRLRQTFGDVSPENVAAIRAGQRALAEQNVRDRYKSYTSQIGAPGAAGAGGVGGASTGTGAPGAPTSTPEQQAAALAQIDKRRAGLDPATQAAVNAAIAAGEDPVEVLKELPPAEAGRPALPAAGPTALPLGGGSLIPPTMSRESAAAAARLETVIPALPRELQQAAKAEIARGADPIMVLAKYERLAVSPLRQQRWDSFNFLFPSGGGQ